MYKFDDENILNEGVELPGGEVEFSLADEELPFEDLPTPENFHENLCLFLPEDKVNTLSQNLLKSIEEDKLSRKDWESSINLMIKYLGFEVEEYRDEPFMKACSAYDTTFSSALIRFYSVARAELFPAMGPVKSEVVGVPTDQSVAEAERVKDFMNHYLTVIDDTYYPESEKLLMYVGLYGCAFRKITLDPISKLPIARTIRPQNLIINNATVSLMSSSRMTHVMHLTRKEVTLRELSGEFIPGSLGSSQNSDFEQESDVNKAIDQLDGVNLEGYDVQDLHRYYEVYADLVLEEKESLNDDESPAIPRPYIVTICATTNKVASIRRNWVEGDEFFNRLDTFVQYYYLPSFGLYGYGLAHIMGSNTIVLTSILRQLVDAATLKNFPAGLKKKGIRVENNNKALGPGEWQEVETGGLPIQQCLMPMPYGEPSPTLVQLRQEIIQQLTQLSSIADTQIPEMSSQAAMGTILAMLDSNSKVQSSVLRSLHVSLAKEFRLLFKLFGETLPEQPYPFNVPGGQTSIMRSDFNDFVNIAPVSDPNILTTTHRLLTSEALLKLAQSLPQIHNMKEAYRRIYTAMNVENIDSLFQPEPQPVSLDPVTENMEALLGKPIEVSPGQDDASHITVHKKFIQDAMNNPQMANPQLMAALTLHIQKHEASLVSQQIQQQAAIMAEQQAQEEMARQQQMEQQYTADAEYALMNNLPPPMPPQRQPGGFMPQGMPPMPQGGEPQPMMPQSPPDQMQVQNALAAKAAQEAVQEMQQRQAELDEQKANAIPPKMCKIP